MKTIIILLTLFLTTFYADNKFLNDQKRFERVRTALQDKGNEVSKNLRENELKAEDLHILIIGYKDEAELEIYGKKKSSGFYKKIKTYAICSSSGRLGPKRRMGDSQVPEGFYHIDRFNPTSTYYLSLGLNYPNESDKLKSTASDPGGDIFIHGQCVTIGCLPMTNEKIKEIYLYAVYAKNNGQQKIPVYIFPFKMTEKNMERYKSAYRHDTALLGFWNKLAKGYQAFQKNKNELTFSVDKKGDYVFAGQ